ncbi:MAG TPA: response regulator transcription factor [Polyangiaceae bacterium]|nr:response regulator transcription factor [Polyangiaceae bacterium]
MTREKLILVVDDEKRIRDVVEYALGKDGFRVVCAAHGTDALTAVEREAPDLIVLDVMLPGLDGIELCRRLRTRSNVPILFLSARSDEVDRVVGLEVGGDDYLTKPFSPRELVARVRAVLRRFSTGQSPNEIASSAADPGARSTRISHGSIDLDPSGWTVRCGSQSIALTATEFMVLAALLERPGVVLTRQQLMQRTHVSGVNVTERTLDTHVRRIRAKFRPFGVDPITTVHGVGYKATPA